MRRLLNASGAIALSFFLNGTIYGQQNGLVALDKGATAGGLSAVASLPRGTTTILGGTIRDVDPVLDAFTLKIMGEKPMKIMYDERTQVFIDGKKIPLRALRPAEHASVQTVLDGTSVFAVSVHILSQLAQGDYQGEVTSYDAATGDLEVVSGKGGTPIRLHVSSDTKFSRTGQSGFTAQSASVGDLQRGSLVSIQFEPDGKGHASATGITFLATPGSRFVFIGNVIALDLHGGTMIVQDPKDNRTYQIIFSPGLPGIQNVHSGQHVQISAEYDGTRYLAQNVTAY